ncbi:MAG: DUF2075 domain-containing protein [Lachnospiraceae bacterium]|nr:DUF2075 domain-containing protein [Lachnospiraceae bacterium]
MPTVNEIRSFPFNEDGLEQVRATRDGKNWPVVYLIHDDENLYIGETTSVATRMSQHLKNEEKKQLEIIEIVFDGKFNKSVVLDYEQRLIKYCSVDKRFKNILNKNKGQQAAHDYFNRKYYRNQFRVLWKQLKDNGLANHSLDIIENDNIFKFSPYNALTGEQNEISIAVINDILDSFEKNATGVSIVDGCAGTGKTVLAISIINSLINAINIGDDLLETKANVFDDEIDTDKKIALLRLKNYIQKERNGKPFKIGFVFPMPGIRETVSKVFKECGNGLEKGMVIAPCDVVKEDYDILVVDESHRLSKRKNLTGYKSFDDTSRELGLDPMETNQLEWILKSAKHVVLFYDQYQSVKSSDITYSEYQSSLDAYANNIRKHKLETQMRCEGGDTYLRYIKEIMSATRERFEKIENYDFMIFDDVNLMVETVRKKDKVYGLSKTVAGFAWDWRTKQRKKPKDNMDCYDMLVKAGEYDILIENNRYIWNLTNEDWVTRQDSHCTIGCIHTSQGYDMNYVGVIFGEEIDYDFETKSIVIDLERYKDKKVKAGTEESVLKELIVNTYTTILARGIKGCYVYACNPNLRKYLKQYISSANEFTLKEG